MTIVDKPMRESDELSRLYRVANDVCYNILTPPEVVEVLEHVRIMSNRVKLFYGYTQHPPIGCDWLREDMMTDGYICRSNSSTLSVPLLLLSTAAKRGYFVHSEAIVKIINLRTAEVLYQHPTYHHPKIEIRKINLQVHPESTHAIFIDGLMREHFSKHKYALTWVADRYLTVALDEGE